MENKSNVGANLVGGAKKVGVATVLKNQTVEKKHEDRREAYLLPCGNEREFCFLQVKRKNARFCQVWKRIIWGKCRHHVETPNCKWEER